MNIAIVLLEMNVFFYVACKLVLIKIIIIGFTHNNSKGTTYHLNKKDVTLKSTGRVQTIYYFSKDSRPTARDKPDGYI